MRTTLHNAGGLREFATESVDDFSSTITGIAKPQVVGGFYSRPKAWRMIAIAATCALLALGLLAFLFFPRAVSIRTDPAGSCRISVTFTGTGQNSLIPLLTVFQSSPDLEPGGAQTFTALCVDLRRVAQLRDHNIMQIAPLGSSQSHD